MTMKKPIVCRAATQVDLPVLLDFEQDIIAYERPYNPTLKPDPISYYDLGELIDREDAEVVVAVAGEDIVGSGSVREKRVAAYFDPPLVAWLGFMYVHPDFRGRGVNGLIMDYLVDWARRRDLFELRLSVYAENDSALRAYEKRGFSPLLLEMRRPLA